MFDGVRPLLDEHSEVEAALADPGVHADPALARRLARRYAVLGKVVAAHEAWQQAQDDLLTARELAPQDAGLREELPGLEQTAAETADALRLLLVPRDPDDDRDAIVEVRAGEGGTESALFAGELVRMYERWAERHGWKTQVIDATLGDLGGVKSATLSLSAPEGGYGVMRHEAGVHRVQRVPVTESAGRVHTSAVGVLVHPEAEEVDVDLDPADVRVDVYRSSGPGGQSVNTTDSAVRVTHVPTGTVAMCQNEKSQLQNREQAMRILRARLLARARAEADADASAARAAQVRTVDRSERVRTYNFGENRVVDHRSGYKAYNLDTVLDGDLDAVAESLARMRTDASLAEQAEHAG
ncbi:peptide chain release factor 1 [Aquipuribacter hungaricus]|uniref:Peptide chain release factor 1 n=1 Tax=Aquipuribacter hungaricus TaxID=545624 RepID=A0ABV7WE75_9MICO